MSGPIGTPSESPGAMLGLVISASMMIGILLFISLADSSPDDGRMLDCAQECEPYAPELRAGFCYCDLRSVRPWEVQR